MWTGLILISTSVETETSCTEGHVFPQRLLLFADSFIHGDIYETDLKDPLVSYFGGRPSSVCDHQLTSPLIGCCVAEEWQQECG